MTDTNNTMGNDQLQWRRSAPLARRVSTMLYGWRHPGWTFGIALLAASPFIVAAILSPALLSLFPALEMIGPISEARALAAGELPLSQITSPLYTLMLMLADIFVDAPGRVHLVANALSAMTVAIPAAFLLSSRLPIIQASALTTVLAAFVAAPFSNVHDYGLALLLVCCFVFMVPSADSALWRARIEGVWGGIALFGLWLVQPVFALAGFAALTASPFLSGGRGLVRYAFAIGLFVLVAILFEFFAPGVVLARAMSTSILFESLGANDMHFHIADFIAVAVAAAIILLSVMVFGGREARMAWVGPLAIAAVALTTALLAHTSGAIVFIVVATLACFSIASPFYDGLFQQHDRASVTVALAAGALSLFWTLAAPVQIAGQFALQHRTIVEASPDIRAQFGLVQPGGATIAKWVENGQLPTSMVIDLLAQKGIDQSAVLLEAASEMQNYTAHGVDVAILTGVDAACLMAIDGRACKSDGLAAARDAAVVLVPRVSISTSPRLRLKGVLKRSSTPISN